MIPENYPLPVLKRIFLDRLYRETGLNCETRFDEAFENERIAYLVNGGSVSQFDGDASCRKVMELMGYLGDRREIDIHNQWLHVVRQRNHYNENRLRRLVDDVGAATKEESFHDDFDMRNDVLWVYRNFSRVVTIGESGEVFFDWDNAIGKSPTAGALMWMEYAAHNRVEFLTKVATRVLLNKTRLAVPSNKPTNGNSVRIDKALTPRINGPDPDHVFVPDSTPEYYLIDSTKEEIAEETKEWCQDQIKEPSVPSLSDLLSQYHDTE